MLRNTMSHRRVANSRDAELTLAPAHPPLHHFMTLYQRYDSLRSSIALFREQTLHTPGLEDWPSVQARFTNLLSHTYSIMSALQSAAPRYIAAQLASLNEFIETEANDVNLFEDQHQDAMHSILYGGAASRPSAGAEGLPEVHYRDAENRLPALAVHPSVPIPDTKVNFLGMLLRTIPDVDISAREDAMVADYAEEHDDDTVEAHIAAHDERSLQALRAWHHLHSAPDSDGNTYDFFMRVDEE